MCGIAGVLQFNGAPVNRDVVSSMTSILAHRGPDGEGLYFGKSVGLGHRRLAILDLTEAGKQPMSNEDETVWITYNGEIYNFQEIRRELQALGYRFHSGTDTEVILQAYEEWGIECLQRFNGMFAFGLWDERKRRLWVVRDRLGVKPLFYSQLPDRFLFGSEIKAILQDPKVERTIDYNTLSYFVSLNYTPAPATLFSHVRQLLPGHYLIVEQSGSIRDIAYWDVMYHENEDRGEQFYMEEFYALLEDSVRLRLISDVPFGAFLSGGLDSSSVSYLMSQNMKERVKTFAIGFGEDSFDELVYARQVASLIQSDHHEHIVTDKDAAILPRLVWHAEEPTADSSMLAVYYLAQMTRQHVTMVLTGDGADEILAGYETYQAFYAQRMYRLLPVWLRRRLVAPLMNSLPVSDSKVSWDFKLRRFVAGAELPAEDAHASWRMIFNAEARQQLLGPVLDHVDALADPLDLYRETFARTTARHPLNRMLYVDTKLYLPNDMLVKVDRMTMAHGLEAREPYLDYRLVEFLARVPPRFKLKYGLHKKYLLKASMQGKLPRTILYRKKQGFNVPNARWMKRELKPFVTDCLSPAGVRRTGLLDNQFVQRVVRDHFEERSDNSHHIWCLLVLVLWFEQFVAGKSIP